MKYLLYFLLARPRPKIYSKGPDVGSKAKRTQYRYKNLLKGQQTLENLGFKKKQSTMDSSDSKEDVEMRQESLSPPPLHLERSRSPSVPIRES